jgi:hypothetical protein
MFQENAHCCHFPEKTPCGLRVVTVEPPSPAAQRCSVGALDGLDGSGTVWKVRKR